VTTSAFVIKTAGLSYLLLPLMLVCFMPPTDHMNSLRWFRRGLFIITLYSIGLSEAYYLPRYGYGIEWLLGALGATAFLAGFWMRAHRDIYWIARQTSEHSLTTPSARSASKHRNPRMPAASIGSAFSPAT